MLEFEQWFELFSSRELRDHVCNSHTCPLRCVKRAELKLLKPTLKVFYEIGQAAMEEHLCDHYIPDPAARCMICFPELRTMHAHSGDLQ